MTDTILDVLDLSVRFGANQVLDKLSFGVTPGTVLAIIGPNGAGKSVLLRTLRGSIPYQGCVEWAPGTRVGYVPQKVDLDRDLPLTGYDLLRARLALARERQIDLRAIFDNVGISEATAERLIGMYSGGQFQRLLIAFALLGNPNVLILDEPTANVDEPGHEQLQMLVARLQREQHLTVMFISHDLSVVSKYANCVLCLGHGRLFIGPPQEILTPEILQEVYGMPLKYHVHEL